MTKIAFFIASTYTFSGNINGGHMSEAQKHDSGKPSWSLLPVDAMLEVVAVYDLGERKYSRGNWTRGMDYHRVFDAMMRHAWAWWSGEERDPEDGQHHLGSVAWCALTLIAYQLRGLGRDDRPKKMIIRRN
jgi:hypothetical protein